MVNIRVLFVTQLLPPLSSRIFVILLPFSLCVIQALDDGVYDQLSSCISVIAQTEIDSCNETLSTHSIVTSNSDKVTPKYNLDCFLQANTVFSEQLTFQFEPVQNDPVSEPSVYQVLRLDSTSHHNLSICQTCYVS